MSMAPNIAFPSITEYMPDKLDIFQMDESTKIITTIEELQQLYWRGWEDGRMYETAVQRNDDELLKEIDEKSTLVHGDIV